MNKSKAIVSLIRSFDNDRKKIKDLIYPYLKNKSLPLDDRWEVYLGTPDYLLDGLLEADDFPLLKKMYYFHEPNELLEFEYNTYMWGGDFVNKLTNGIDFLGAVTPELIIEVKEKFLQECAYSVFNSNYDY